MRNIWVTSDHHFGHANILRFKRKDGSLVRPGFDSVEEMDSFMIEKWNSVVKPGDLVYHLGDVTFDRPNFPNIIKQLNGSKRLVVGNHDDVKWLSTGGWFKKVMMWRMFPEMGLIFSHVPLHESSFFNEYSSLLNVHGHVHHNPSPEGPYHNVCVEVTDYTPVHIEELRMENPVAQKT